MEDQNTQAPLDEASPDAIDTQITDAVTQPDMPIVAIDQEGDVAQGEPPSIEPLLHALENCRLYAAKRPKEEWARNILRFCSEAGVNASPLR